jgi:CheY-like chemotaxis protein
MGCTPVGKELPPKIAIELASRKKAATITAPKATMANFGDMVEEGVILVVEDNEDDVFLMKRMLKSSGVSLPVVAVENGQLALDYLSSDAHPQPAVVFLDLKLPLLSGHEVLAWIRQQPHLEGLAVVVVTSSDEPSDVRRAYSLGANSYLVKPLTPRQLLGLAKAFNWPWVKGAVEPVAAPPPKVG